MKHIIFFLCTFIPAMYLTAQEPPVPPAGPPASGGNPAARQMSRTGHVFGKLVDQKGAPVPFANVLVLQNRYDSITAQNKDFVLKATMTENNGDFSLEEIPVRPGLKLKIAYYGYDTYEEKFTFPAMTEGGAMAVIEKDFGKIAVKETEVSALDEVKITAVQAAMQLDVDKKVFNVSQNTMSEGGTAEDVMKNVPSVNVDIDGNVTMRNSAPQIFLDGRPTTLTLDQIPAESIESIEVITNPSAKYDASGGGGGILNIVLKKNKKTGYNGSIRAGVNQYGGGNLGVDFNVRQNKINFTGGLNGRLNNGVSFGTVDRTNLTNGIAQTNLRQSNDDIRSGGGFFGRLGIDYLMTNRTTLSLSGVTMQGSRNSSSDQDIYTDSLVTLAPATFYSRRTTDNDRSMKNYGLVFGLKHLFPTAGEEFTFDANYNNWDSKSEGLYRSDFYTGSESSSVERYTLQKTEGSGNFNNLVLQTDYVKPFKKFKLETGLRAALRTRTTVNNNYMFDQQADAYQLVYNQASNFKNWDNVYAAYGTISNQVKNFGYKVGLRAESSDYRGELTNTGQTFRNTYPISLFPSLFLTQKFKKDQDLQLSYTRRIERPDFRQLIPFVDSVDQFNISRGNAGLKPEFTEIFELAYMKRYKQRNTFLGSVYYKYTNNLITRFIEQADNGALINTYVNANSSYAAGIELTSQNYLTKWWDITTNVNIYNSKINNSNITEFPQAALWSGFAKFNSNFRLPANFSIQLSAMYQSKTNVPTSDGGGGGPGGGGGGGGMQAQSTSQGYIKEFYAVDFAIKKTLLKNKMSVSLNINDIFRTRYNISYSESAYFIQDYRRISNPQMVRLNLTYNFGKMDALLFKRKTKGTGEDMSE